MLHPPLGALLDTLKNAQHSARLMKVHKRQCLLLCTFVENALTKSEEATEEPVLNSQQWDDTLSVLRSRLATWADMSLVQSYLQSDQVRIGIDELYTELKWTGINMEGSPLQLHEKRRQDEDSVQDLLRTICLDNHLLDELFRQPTDSIRLFIKRLQNALHYGSLAEDVRPRLDRILKSLYNSADVHIRTPDITLQVHPVDAAPFDKSAMYSSYNAFWLDEPVVVKALRRPKDRTTPGKALGKDFEQYFNARHPNIARVYGMYTSDALGYCVVTPQVDSVDILSYLEDYGEFDILALSKDIADALQFLHSLDPPVAMGYICSNSVVVKDDRIMIREFGLLQLSGQPVKAVKENLPWCAPELIRAAKRMQHTLETPLACTRESDIYSYAMFLFGKVFTGQVPYSHIPDASLVEPEILHGTRPIMSEEHKPRAVRRGWSPDVQKVMKACWNADPKKRLSALKVSEHISSIMDDRVLSPSGINTDRPPSSSSGSSISLGSGDSNSSRESRSNSLQYPHTPETKASSITSSPPLRSDTSSLFNQAHVSWLSTSSRVNELLGGVTEEPVDISTTDDMARKMSAISFQSDNLNTSEKTIRANPNPRSSFSDDSDEEGHLGKANSAYERMPKLRNPSLSSTRKRANRDRFDILTGRMTVDGQINPRWAGVASMEGLRSITRGPRRLAQVTAVEKIVDRECAFCRDRTSEVLAHRLREDPAVLGDEARTEAFLSAVFEDSHNLRLVNEHFKNALQACADVVAVGFSRMALLCKEAASQFIMTYPEYIHNLPVVEKTIEDEIKAKSRFAFIMKERVQGELTFHEALLAFLRAPKSHLDAHPRVLELILKEMSVEDPERAAVLDAQQEMTKAVHCVRLANWQQAHLAEEKCSWKDFVLPDVMRTARKEDVQRQSAIFALIGEEREYVKKLGDLRTVLYIIQSEVANLKRAEDAAIKDLMKSLDVILGDFLRFHHQLLDNFFTLQRSQHPFIGPIVSTCGIAQMPWHSLYAFRFASSYQKLAKIMEGSKVRAGIFRRVMQSMVHGESDFMTFLRLPSLHLAVLVKFLMQISESTAPENEDRQLLDEQLPRLWETCRQVEAKTSSKERARLTSLASALDFSKFLGSVEDIQLASESRILVMSGEVMLGSGNAQDGQVRNEKSFAILLDNYLIVADRTDNQGILRFVVSHRPLPLDIAQFNVADISPTNVGDFVPCVTVTRSGGIETPLQLYTPAEMLDTWRIKFQEALKARSLAREASKLIDLELLHKFIRAPNCSSEFRTDGPVTLAIASMFPSSGVWIKQSTDTTLHHAVDLPNVKNLKVVKELRILLAQSETNLYAYRLDDLLKGNGHSSRSLDDAIAVQFFRVGILKTGIFLVVYGTRKGKSVLRFYDASQSRKSPKVLSFKNKFGPFNFYAEAEMTYEVKDVQFLSSSLVLITESFQLVTFNGPAELKDNLTSAKRQLVPFSGDAQVELVDRCHASEPMAVHRFSDNFVLCYKTFAAFININGKLSPKTIEWEVNDVRRIIFRPPYMLIFGSRAIEVREIATRELKQLIPLPGNIEVSYEALNNSESNNVFGIHVTLESVDGNMAPFNLLRICRRYM